MDSNSQREYLIFFANYARAILEFKDWDDMCLSAYHFIKSGSIFSMSETGILEEDSKINGLDLLDYLISHFERDPEKVMYLATLREELKEIKS